MKTQTAFIALCAAILNASAFAQEAAAQSLTTASVPTEVANIAVAAVPATETVEKRQLLEEIELDEEDENLENDLDMDEEDLVDEEEDEEDENLEDDLDMDEEDLVGEEDENLAEDDEDMDEEDVEEDDLDLDEEDLDEDELDDENLEDDLDLDEEDLEEADEEFDEEDLVEDDDEFDEEDFAEDDEDFDEEDLAEDDEDFDEEDLEDDDEDFDEEDLVENDEDFDEEDLAEGQEDFNNEDLQEIDEENLIDNKTELSDLNFDDLDFDEEDFARSGRKPSKKCKRSATQAGKLRHKVFKTVRNMLQLRGNKRARIDVIRTVFADALGANDRLQSGRKISRRDYTKNRVAFLTALRRLNRMRRVTARSADEIISGAKAKSLQTVRAEEKREANKFAVRLFPVRSKERPYTAREFFRGLRRASTSFKVKEGSVSKRGKRYLRDRSILALAVAALKRARFLQKRGLFASQRAARSVMGKLRNFINVLNKRLRNKKTSQKSTSTTVKRSFPTQETYNLRKFFARLNKMVTAMVRRSKRNGDSKGVIRVKELALAQAAVRRARTLAGAGSFSPKSDAQRVVSSLKRSILRLKVGLGVSLRKQLLRAKKVLSYTKFFAKNSEISRSRDVRRVNKIYRRIVKNLKKKLRKLETRKYLKDIRRRADQLA